MSVTFYGRRNCGDVTKLRLFNREIILDYLDGPLNVMTQISLQERGRERVNYRQRRQCEDGAEVDLKMLCCWS